MANTTTRTTHDDHGGKIVEDFDSQGRVILQRIYAPGGQLDNKTEWFDGPSGRMMRTIYYSADGAVVSDETDPA